MAKKTGSYICGSCKARFTKWSGRCQACGEWDSIVDDSSESVAGVAGSYNHSLGHAVDLTDLSSVADPPARTSTAIQEFDHVLGGGIVPASSVLVGGDPGIGKSTLLLQAAAGAALKGNRVIYFSGEEAADQIKMRAERLDLEKAPVLLATATSLRDILATLEAERPGMAVIDSIQTMWSDTIESAPGTTSQVRAIAHEIVRFAKKRGTSVILVGHVTKDGQIAGPRAVEHLVDTVAYFEGERGHQYRILRTVKNRFGPAGEIGVFEMTGKGLIGVENTAALFLSERDQFAPGSIVFAGIEGTRPILVEIQALVAQSAYGTPRRNVVGWDAGRMAMILAVLEARCGIGFAGHDVYLNVAGGIRITEPAADLAVVGALLSAHFDSALPADLVAFGEVGLSGTLRPSSQPEQRLKEAEKLGFTAALAPAPAEKIFLSKMEIRQIAKLADFLAEFAEHGGSDR